jgi:ABC-type nitrate/sulfonate/bicarbonate transport system substrate-binding protein
MTEVSVVLDYLHPWPNAAGFYVARQRGWYAEAGLQVELRTHDYGWGDTLEYLSRRRADFGVFPPNRLLVRRERGDRLLAIAAINHEGLEAVQVAAGRGIERPRDLAGRRVGYAVTPRAQAMVRTIVAADGGDPDSLVPVDTGSAELTPEFLVSSGLDATFGGYWAWDVLSEAAAAGSSLVWPMRDLGVPSYHSYVLGAHEELLETDPGLIRSFVAATGRGFLAAAADQPRTLELLRAAMPYVPAWRLARSLELVAPTWTHDGTWGGLRDELLGPYAAWLAAHQILHAPHRWAESVTTAFLTARPGPAVTP